MLKDIQSYFSLKQLPIPPWRDSVSGDMEFYFEDCFGDVYMKTSKWSLYAVPVHRDIVVFLKESVDANSAAVGQ